MKLVTSLTGLINGALPSILENAMGVMGVSFEKLEKMNGRELLAGLLNISDQLQKANGNGGNQKINIEVLSEQINGNHAVVHIRDMTSNQETDIKLIRELVYWKIDFVEDPNAPVFPLEYFLKNAGLGR